MNELKKYNSPEDDVPDIKKQLPQAEIDIATLARKNFFVPNVEILTRAFKNLPPVHRIQSNHFDMLVEEQEQNLHYEDFMNGGMVESYKRGNTGFIRFTKVRDNEKIIWIYIGPVKLY